VFSGRLIILWLHLSAILVWIGGLLFFALVWAPSFKGDALTLDRIRLAQRFEERFQFFISRALEVAILTGIFNLLIRLIDSRGSFPSSYLSILTLKLILVVIMIALQLVNKRAFAAKRLTLALEASQELSQLRGPFFDLLKRSAFLISFNVAIGIVVLFLALALSRL